LSAAILRLPIEEEVVRVKKIAIVTSLALSGLMAGTVRASEDDQAIKVNFSQAVQIPGHVLPAGTYYFVIMNTNDRQTVQITNEGRTRTIAIVYSIGRERWQGNAGTEFTLAEGHGVEPAAIIAWFYPGRTAGHEFLYPAQEEKELAMAKKDTQSSGD
jgi:hypothetical protein